MDNAVAVCKEQSLFVDLVVLSMSCYIPEIEILKFHSAVITGKYGANVVPVHFHFDRLSAFWLETFKHGFLDYHNNIDVL